MRNLSYIVFCLLFFVMCTEQTKEQLPELSRAEKLMQCFPDSALAVLDSMEIPSPSDKFQYATWCLLITQARDKNYIKPTSDSLINIALNYFEKQDDPVRKATALYYEGRVNHDLNNAEEATNYYLRARDVAKNTTDYKLLCLINIHLGTLYAYRGLADLALEAYQNAYDYSVQLKDSALISNSYSYLGRVASLKNDFPKELNYSKKAVEVAEQSGSLRALTLAYGEISLAYRALSMLDSSIYYLEKIKEIEGRNNTLALPQTYLGIGEAYYLKGQPDSAYTYFKKALNTTNIYTKQNAIQGLYYLYRDIGKHEEAVKYNEQYWIYKDSVDNINHSTKIAEIQAKYDQAKLLNINAQLEIKKEKIKNRSFWGLTICVILIGGLIFLYQHKLIKKELTIKNVKDLLNSDLVQLHKNESVIRQNKNLIESLSSQLETISSQLQSRLVQLHESEDLIRQKETQIESLSSQVDTISYLKGYINDLKSEIERIRQNNVALQTQNEILQKDIKKYTCDLEEKGEKFKTYEHLAAENVSLHEREEYLCSQLIKHVGILNGLMFASKCIPDSNWPEIYDSMNIVYPYLIDRLRKDFSLPEVYLQICCLIKLKLSNSAIATLTGISTSSVIKRKQRLKDQISQHLETPLGKEASIDIYIWKY